MKLVGRLIGWMAVLGVAAAANAVDLNEDSDWQGWYGIGASMKSGEWKLKVAEEIRTGNDMHNVYYNHMDVGLSRPATSWLDLGVNFRHVEEKKKGEWLDEYRPYVDGKLKCKIGGWAFSDRNRFEFRDLEGSDDKWRYRNKLTAYLPFKLFGENVKPYIADEIYQDMSGKDMERNRVYAGAECKFASWLKGDIFYIYQSSYKNREWLDINVVSFLFEITF